MLAVFKKMVLREWLLIALGALLVYALAGAWLLPLLIQRSLPDLVRDTLQREASIGAVRINPFLLSLEVEQFRLRETDGREIAGLARLYADFDATGLLRGELSFARIRLEQPELHVERTKNGELNLVALLQALPTSENDPATGDSEPYALQVDALELSGGRIHYRDQSADQAVDLGVEAIELQLSGFSTRPGARNVLSLAASLHRGGTLQLNSEFGLQPVAATGQLALADFPAATAWPFARQFVRLAEFGGRLDFATGFAFAPTAQQSGLHLSNLRVKATDLSLAQPTASAPLLALQTLELSEASVDFDQQRVQVPVLLLDEGSFSLAIAADGSIDWAGLLVEQPTEPKPPTAPWQITLEQIRVQDLAVHAIDHSRPVPTRLEAANLAATIALQINMGETTRVTLRAPQIELRELAVQPETMDEPLVFVDAMQLLSGAFDTQAQSIEIGELLAQGGRVDLKRDPDRRLRVLKLLIGSEQAGSTAAQTPPWHYALGKLRLEGFSATIHDATLSPPLQLQLDDIEFGLEGLSSAHDAQTSYRTSLHSLAGGSLNSQGTVGAGQKAVQGTLIVEKLNLEPLESLIVEYTTLDLKSALASAAIEWEYAEAADTSAIVSAAGTASIHDLKLVESGNGAPVLGWTSVSANGIEYHSTPGSLLIQDLRVIEPDVRVEIFADSSVNLSKALRPRDVQAPPIANAEVPDFAIELPRIRVERGKIDYSDQSLVLPFATKIHDFRGTVSGISSNPESRARINLRGRVEQYGTAKVSGTISAFTPQRYVSVHTEFSNVEMSDLSPYSATFAGREIDSGKLSLDLEYRIEDGVLRGDSSLMLEQFTLGKKVASESAVDLPLDLAVALLSDSNGRINLAIPVSGNLDAPEFSLGKVVGEAISQALTKIITAPFRALGALFGGANTDQLKSIRFDSGSALIEPPQLEKLKLLADALQQKPALRLIVTGRYDPARDGLALRALHVRRAVSSALDIELEEDERVAPVVFDEAKSQRAIELVYEQRNGEDSVDAFQQQYEQDSGQPVERINRFLALFSKPSPDSEFYKALFKKLVKTQALADEELPALARLRAEGIVNALVSEASLAPDRLATNSVKAVGKSAKSGVETTLELGVGKS